MSRRPPVPLFSDIRPSPFSLLSAQHLTTDRQTQDNGKRDNETGIDEARSPKPSKLSRKVTLSGAQHPQGIQKPHFNTDRARKDGSSKTSSTSLEAILTRHAQNLLTTEQNTLSSTISQHLNSFTSLTTRFHETLALETAHLEKATRPIASEEVRIQHRTPRQVRNESTGDLEWKVRVQHEDINVGAEMEKLRATVTQAESELDALWREWEDVQTQLYALVLEVVDDGDDDDRDEEGSVKALLALYQPDPSSPPINATLVGGLEARRAHLQANEEVEKKVAEVEEEIGNNAREIRKASGELQKQYVRTVEGGLEKIQNLILGLVG